MGTAQGAAGIFANASIKMFADRRWNVFGASLIFMRPDQTRRCIGGVSMNVSYFVFMGLMFGAWITMVSAWIATIRFVIDISKQSKDSKNNPARGMAIWVKFFTNEGFGPDAEPKRRQIIRTFKLAIFLFALAIFAFVVLPVVPG